MLIPLGLTATLAADPGIRKKINGSVTLVGSNKVLKDIIKIVKFLGDSGILLKGITKLIENKTKEQRGGVLSMLLGRLGASLLGNLLSGKRVIHAGDGVIRVGHDF